MPRFALSATLVLVASSLWAQDGDEVAFVREVLSDLQVPSIRENREYCGYIGYDDAGTLKATQAVKGDTDSCAPIWPDDFDVVASYHTHAGFDEEAYSETPSSTDMEADEADGIDGYVSTPGGRLWYIDSVDMMASQLCGLQCLPSDPDFVEGAQGRVEISYSYEELIDLENSE